MANNRYTITKNVLKEYDKYVFEQKVKREQIGEVDILLFVDWLDQKLIILQKNPQPKIEKRKFLDFVYLTNEEYNRLCLDYGEKTTKHILDRLNDYIGSKGDKYKSHFYTITAWIKKGGLKKIEQKQDPKPIKEEVKELTEEQKQKAKEQLNAFRTKMTNGDPQPKE